MALARLGGARRPENYTWPGFVDALATLLMVIIFVLLVFVLIQVNLAYRVAGQDATMNDMRAQIVSLGDLLNLERKANDELKDELAGISSLLDATTKERDSLVTQLANATATLSLRDSEIRQLTAIQAQTEESLEAARQTIADRVAALEAIELTLQRHRRSSWNQRSRSPTPPRALSVRLPASANLKRRTPPRRLRSRK